MVLFGQNPSQGTLFKAGQFLAGTSCCARQQCGATVLPTRRAEELPVRLAHRVKELDELPHNLSDMPSIQKVKNWYAQSFQVRLLLPEVANDGDHHCDPIIRPPHLPRIVVLIIPVLAGAHLSPTTTATEPCPSGACRFTVGRSAPPRINSEPRARKHASTPSRERTTQ